MKKITYEQFTDEEFIRAMQMKEKSEVVWLMFLELDGLLNMTKLAKKYFGKSHSWMSQKLHGHSVCSKEKSFTEAEYTQMAAAMRQIASRLNYWADAIDKAEMEAKDL